MCCIFRNDLCLVIETISLYNHADVNVSFVIDPAKRFVKFADCKIGVDWFNTNGMKPNPDKFQFIILLPDTANAV